MSKINENIIDSWARQLTQNYSETENDKAIAETDEELNNEYNVYKRTWKTVTEMQEIEQFDTDKAWNKLFAKIDDEETLNHKPKEKTIKLNRMLAIAASVLIFIGIAGYYFTTQMGIISYTNNSLQAQVISLPDGSEVHLNANANINYKKQFGKKTREVSLTGEAFFSVAKDLNKPFIVKSGNSFVKVLGTSFNVNAKTNLIEVAVKTGRVEVYNQSAGSDHIILLPGDFAVLDGVDRIEKKETYNANYLSWMDKKLVFKALPLSQVIADLMNAYNCNIELADSALQNLKITTTFDNDSIDDVLASISLALNLNYKKDRDTYIIVSNY